MSDKYYLALNAHPKIGSQTIKKAVNAFDGSVDNLWSASSAQVRNRLEKKISDLVLEAKGEYSPDEELAKLLKLNIGYITNRDKQYPKLLKEIPDHPVVLYARGNIDVLSSPALAFVGSRKYSEYGKRSCRSIINQMNGAEVCIVSGLALGIDAIAHSAALENDLSTVGVLGCGLDRIYPVSNYQLGESIIKSGGAIISEYPPGTPPMKQNFPARNRIIAGLSLGTVVVEAAEKSGALITALEALDYNREVFAVPGNIESETSKGCNQLIQQGAKLTTGAEDIFLELNFEIENQKIKSQKAMPENEIEAEILKITSEKTHVDMLVGKSKYNVVEISGALTTLEMKGNLENVGGGYWIRNNE